MLCAIMQKVIFLLKTFGGVIMSRQCVICGKGRVSGNNVSHSVRRTKRTFNANVHKVEVEINGKKSREYVCTRCMRTAKKDEENV
jgi:large subunit ribosomal protein L28